MTQIRVYIREIAGTSRTSVELPDDVPMYELLPILAEHLNLPTTTGSLSEPIEYSLCNLRTNIPLEDEDTMSSAGIQTDDELTLSPFMYASLPIRTIKDIQYVVSKFGSTHILFAVFLYTNQDKSLVAYIRNNFDELNFMSGKKCLVFILEKPSRITKHSFSDLAQEKAEGIWTKLNLDRNVPFDRNQAYNIADHFGVMPSQLPCVVFFRGPESKEILIVEINDFVKQSDEISESSYTYFFRLLFSSVYRATTRKNANWLSELGKLLDKRRRKDSKGKMTSLEVISLTKSLIEIIGTAIKALF